MSRLKVVDPQVKVDLLRRTAVRPVGRDVFGGQLDSYPRLTVDDHHVPVSLGVDRATEHSSPKAAFGGQVSGIEDDDLVVDLHRAILARFAGPEHAHPVAVWYRDEDASLGEFQPLGSAQVTESAPLPTAQESRLARRWAPVCERPSVRRCRVDGVGPVGLRVYVVLLAMISSATRAGSSTWT